MVKAFTPSPPPAHFVTHNPAPCSPVRCAGALITKPDEAARYDGSGAAVLKDVGKALFRGGGGGGGGGSRGTSPAPTAGSTLLGRGWRAVGKQRGKRGLGKWSV